MKIFALLLLPLISSANENKEIFDLNIKGSKIQIVLGREGPAKEAAFVVTRMSKQVQKVKELGTQFGFFTVDGKQQRAIFHDFDRDGIPEFSVRTTQPPLIGSLWIFRWDGSKFVPLKNAEGDRYFPVPLESSIEWKNEQFSFQLGAEKRAYTWSNGKITLQR